MTAVYRLTSSILASNAQPVIRTGDGATIPNDPRNADWQTYLVWLAVPNTPDPIPTPSAAQAAQNTYNAAVAAGLAVTSTGTSSVNGTYSFAQAQQDNLANVSLYIAVNGKFPGGLSALVLQTVSGTIIQIPTKTLWQAIATAFADYIAQLDTALLTAQAGGTPSWPSATVTIP